MQKNPNFTNYDDHDLRMPIWNWGAFLFTPFWALENQVWIGLISWFPWILIVTIQTLLMTSFASDLVSIIRIVSFLLHNFIFPYVYLPTAVVLGLYGNKWAWRSGRWQNLEGFKAHQHVWLFTGLFIGIPFTLTTWYVCNRMSDWTYVLINVLRL